MYCAGLETLGTFRKNFSREFTRSGSRKGNKPYTFCAALFKFVREADYCRTLTSSWASKNPSMTVCDMLNYRLLLSSEFDGHTSDECYSALDSFLRLEPGWVEA